MALTLAMVIHEPTTNAVRYGALSAPAGRVDVMWQVERGSQPPVLRIDWCESGGPPVTEPERRGFGSRFVEGGIADPAGLRCTMRVRHEAAVAVPERDWQA